MGRYETAAINLFEGEQKPGGHRLLTGTSTKTKCIEPADGNCFAPTAHPAFLVIDGTRGTTIRKKELEVAAPAILIDNDLVGKSGDEDGIWRIEIYNLLDPARRDRFRPAAKRITRAIQQEGFGFFSVAHTCQCQFLP